MPYMGGNSNSNSSRQKKSFSSSSLSLFNFMKSSRRPRRGDEAGNWDDAMSARKVWPSDEDKVRWVADPRINTKASAFIAHFHATRLSEPERQVLPAAGKASK